MDTFHETGLSSRASTISLDTVRKCSKCRVTYPVSAFENEFKKCFKTCNHCRKSGKDGKRLLQTMCSSDEDFEDLNMDMQQSSFDEFLEEYGDVCNMLKQNQGDSENSSSLNTTWIISFPSSKKAKEVAEDICVEIQETDDYHWM